MANVIGLSQEHVRYLLFGIRRNRSPHKTLLNEVQRNKPIVDDEEIEIAILGYFAAYPTISLRQVARDSGLSKNSVHRILRKHKFHPYKFFIVQHLKETDFPRRVRFCEFILTWSQGNELFLDNIIWTDEAKFTKNGVFNRHNCHYWSDSNQHVLRELNFQESWQFNVYCAIRSDSVVALHFYQENLNSEGYLNILHNFENEYLDTLPNAEHRNLFYQHDEAPSHNGRLVNTRLKELFDDQWIANNGPFLWPPALQIYQCSIFSFGVQLKIKSMKLN